MREVAEWYVVEESADGKHWFVVFNDRSERIMATCQNKKDAESIVDALKQRQQQPADVVERVALAIWEAADHRVTKDWSRAGSAIRGRYRKQAKAALASVPQQPPSAGKSVKIHIPVYETVTDSEGNITGKRLVNQPPTVPLSEDEAVEIMATAIYEQREVDCHINQCRDASRIAYRALLPHLASTPTSNVQKLVGLLQEAHIQIKNFYCDGSHAAQGCDACIFQNQVQDVLTAYRNNSQGGAA